MLYHISLYLTSYYSVFNVVHYISFRSIAALLTAFVGSLFFGSYFIKRSSTLFSLESRKYTPDSHKLKGKVPTIGGVFIIATVILTLFLWANLLCKELWIFMLCFVFFGGIGFWDDWSKVMYKQGISERKKFGAQILVSLMVVALWIAWCNPLTTMSIPFFKDINPDLGILFIPCALFILVGTSNAVNLADGLDGLAISSLIANFSTFSLIAYAAGHVIIASYLHIPFAQSAEITVIGGALIGASVGFLWYNAYPAQMFMGDVGSLSLGSALGFMALCTKQELLLPISGGLFVLETLSVVIQVLFYKKYKKRFFKRAPIHHHFELLGLPESKITTRFTIISCMLCLCALLMLKIR